MEPRGRHLLAEYHGCAAEITNDAERVEAILRAAAAAAGASVLTCQVRRFAPQGVTGVALLAESHLSIHTWPEHGYVAVDIFTCGEGDPYAAHALLAEALGAQTHELMLIERGCEGLRVAERRRDP